MRSSLLLLLRRRGLGAFLLSAQTVVACIISSTTPLKGQTSVAQEKVAQLAALPGVQEAFRTIERLDPWTQDKLIDLTQIPAPPFQEEERAAAFAELLESVGADSVRIDEVGNVLAFRGGKTARKTVVLGAHMDTVFPEGTDVTVEFRGDTLFAPGVGDDTRGMVVILTVLRALVEVGLRTDANLVFLGSVGEEGVGDLRGVKHFFREGGPGADAFIEVDGAGGASIVSMGLGSVRYRVRYSGDGGHSWGAFGLVNPAHALARAIHRFSLAADSLTSSGPRTSFNVGRIGGGTSINSIPFEAWMEVDMRSESPASLEAISRAFLKAVDEAAHEENEFRRDGPPVQVNVERIGLRPSGETDPSTPLVQRAMAVTRYFGEEPFLIRSSTNSNLPISLGIPAVTIGRGGAGGANHSPGEWWLNKDGHIGIQRALLLLIAEAGYSG
jgi:acetylornithine deacetylase/succinyl-diaminopimelate desuccinylase-like protein